MASNKQATVSVEGQDCFSARALSIDQQSDQELLYQLFRMAFLTCESSMFVWARGAMTCQPDVRSWRRAEGEHCSAEQCSFLSQEVLQQ